MSENSKIEWTHHTFNPVRGCTKLSPGCANCYAAREAVRFPGIRGIWGDKGTRILAVPSAWNQPLKWNRQAVCYPDQCTKCGTRLCMDAQVKIGNATCPARHDAKGKYDSSIPECGGVVALDVRPRVFCASLADVFEDWQGELRFPASIAIEGWLPAWWDGRQIVREFPEAAEKAGMRKATMADMRAELFSLIEATPNLDWQLLTKRPENVMRMVPAHWREAFPDNVWMGTTVEDRARKDRIAHLKKIPAKVLFLSVEPQLEDLGEIGEWAEPQDGGYYYIDGIHWVICGGESGPGCRPFDPDWARSLRDQCRAAGVPFFMKQMGGTRKPFPEIPADLMIREFPVGKEGA